MSDPLAHVTLRLAAANPLVEGVPAAALVAAGHTLLQRCAPLVRLLATERPALLLEPGAALLTALAACDGHGAVWLDPAARSQWPAVLASHAVGPVFTTAAHAAAFTAAVTGERLLVLLDETPRRAIVRGAGADRVIDLGNHFPLALEGEADAPGLLEPCLWAPQWWTHRALISEPLSPDAPALVIWLTSLLRPTPAA